MSKVKVLVTPWEQKRRKPKWDSFVKRNRRAIQEWDREHGATAALPVIFDVKSDEYIWVSRAQRREAKDTQIQKLEDYRGFWQYIKTFAVILFRRWILWKHV